MVRILYILMLLTLSLGTNTRADEKFEIYKRHLKRIPAKVSSTCPQEYRDILYKFVRAIRHHDVAFVRAFVRGSDEVLLSFALSGPYEFSNRVLKPASALQLAVFSQDQAIVGAILNVAVEKPDMAPYVFLTGQSQSAVHMAAYLDDANVLSEFISFAKRNPSFWHIMWSKSILNETPLETAFRYRRMRAAACLLSRTWDLPLVYSTSFFAVTGLLSRHQ